MDRLAGVQDPNNKEHFKPIPFQLLGPYGMAVNSKGDLYVADQKVGAIFVFNTETKEITLIGNGRDATFGMINGVAFDDDDRAVCHRRQTASRARLRQEQQSRRP